MAGQSANQAETKHSEGAPDHGRTQPKPTQLNEKRQWQGC